MLKRDVKLQLTCMYVLITWILDRPVSNICCKWHCLQLVHVCALYFCVIQIFHVLHTFAMFTEYLCYSSFEFSLQQSSLRRLLWVLWNHHSMCPACHTMIRVKLCIKSSLFYMNCPACTQPQASLLWPWKCFSSFSSLWWDISLFRPGWCHVLDTSSIVDTCV